MTDNYYNGLAPYYKYIYPNWEASVQRQAEALDSVIREFVGDTIKNGFRCRLRDWNAKYRIGCILATK